jgi:hypothetical protein
MPIRPNGFGQVIRSAVDVLGRPCLLDADGEGDELACALPGSCAKGDPPDDQDGRICDFADPGKVQARPDHQNTSCNRECLRLQQLLELLAHLRRDFRNRRLDSHAQPLFDRRSSYVRRNRYGGQRHADRLH